MLKWKILAVLGVAFGVAGMGWGYAQQKNAVGFFELRIYTAQPGKRDALAARFASRTAAIYARHGITNVGYWIPQQSDPELGISAEIETLFHRQHYVYPDNRSYDVSYYLVKNFSGTVKNNVFAHWLWVPVAELHSYDVLKGNKDVIKKLLDHFGPR